jgi:cytochrome P450
MNNAASTSQQNLNSRSFEQVRRSPPGPPLTTLVKNTFRLLRDRREFLLKAREDYGDVVRIPTLFGSFYLAFHPRDVRRILQENYRNYNRETIEFRLVSLVVGDSLLTTDGPSWLAQRRLMQPAFHHRHLAALGQSMSEIAQARLKDWEARGLIDSGVTLDVSVEMNDLTLETVARALFGMEVNEEILRVSQTFTTVQRLALEALSLPFLLLLPTPQRHRFRKACRELNEVVDMIIQTRRQQPEGYGDLLEMILQARDETGQGMDDQQARQEVLTMLLAGYETTASGLTWTLYLLGQYPAVQEQVRAELRQVLGGKVPGVEDFPRLPVLRRVLDEALRLYPPAWMYSRRAVERDELSGYTLPKGASIIICPYVTHRHPAFWDSPDTFDPERFLPERSKERIQGAYFPFGNGPHICIGNQFALTEAQLFLATLLSRYAVRLVPGTEVTPEALFALHPRGGLPITLHSVK